MTTVPYLMVYVYNADEDAIEPFYDIEEKIEMSLEEMIEGFMDPCLTNGIVFSEFVVMLKDVINTAH